MKKVMTRFILMLIMALPSVEIQAEDWSYGSETYYPRNYAVTDDFSIGSASERSDLFLDSQSDPNALDEYTELGGLERDAPVDEGLLMLMFYGIGYAVLRIRKRNKC